MDGGGWIHWMEGSTAAWFYCALLRNNSTQITDAVEVIVIEWFTRYLGR
jgi:hypothetical protein